MYDEAKAQRNVNFINSLKHTKGQWRGVAEQIGFTICLRPLGENVSETNLL